MDSLNDIPVKGNKKSCVLLRTFFRPFKRSFLAEIGTKASKHIG